MGDTWCSTPTLTLPMSTGRGDRKVNLRSFTNYLSDHVIPQGSDKLAYEYGVAINTQTNEVIYWRSWRAD